MERKYHARELSHAEIGLSGPICFIISVSHLWEKYKENYADAINLIVMSSSQDSRDQAILVQERKGVLF